jgi:hypothetical protein
MDGLPYQKGGKHGNKRFDYTLNRPIPAAVLSGPELTTARNLGSRLARVADRLKDLRVSTTTVP